MTKKDAGLRIAYINNRLKELVNTNQYNLDSSEVQSLNSEMEDIENKYPSLFLPKLSQKTKTVNTLKEWNEIINPKPLC